MFFDIGSLEFIALIILAILVFGPDKLPKMIQDAARFVRKIRDFSDSAKRDIRAELGPEFKDFEFEDLNPKKFAKKHLLDNDELGLKELRGSLDVRKELTEVADAVNGHAPAEVAATNGSPDAGSPVDGPVDGASAGAPVRLDKGDKGPRPVVGAGSAGGTGWGEKSPAAPASDPPPFDADAT